MSVTESFTAPTDRSTVLTTQLNALADAAYSAAGSDYDNTTNKDQFAFAQLAVTFASAPTADATVDLFSVLAPDGTNFEDGGGAVRPPPMRYLGSFIVRAVTSAQLLVTQEFRLPSTHMKFIAYNGAGFAFPASGSTIKLLTFNRQVG